jgi:hypothetical protein
MSANSNEADYGLVAKAVAIVAVGVVIPGLIARFLNAAGYDIIGTFVFGMSFFGMVVLVWYVWIRPLDLTGPMG